MPSHTHYLWFNTRQRQEIIDLTDAMSEQVQASGIRRSRQALVRDRPDFKRLVTGKP